MRWLDSLITRWFKPKIDAKRRLHSYQHAVRLIAQESDDILSGHVLDLIDVVNDLTWSRLTAHQNPQHIIPHFPNIDQCVMALQSAKINLVEDRTQVWDKGLQWELSNSYMRIDKFLVTESGHPILFDVAARRLGEAMRDLIVALVPLSTTDPIRFRYHLLRISSLLEFSRLVLITLIKSSEQHIEAQASK